MNLFSWLPHDLTEAERHLLQTLERRRLENRGQLFALIADPHRRFRRVCSLYLSWLQRHAMPEAISPSLPYHRGIFSILPRACYPALPFNAPHVCLILGDPYRIKRNHFRRYWLKLARDNPECILCRPEAELAERRVRLLAQRIARKASSPPRRLIRLPTPTPQVRKIFVPAASFSERKPLILPTAFAA